MSDFTSLFLSYPLFLRTFKRIRRLYNPQSQSFLLKKHKTSETFLLKEETQLNEEKLQELISLLKNLFLLHKNKSFAKIIHYSFTKDSHSSLSNLFLIYEFFECSLDKEILSKIKNEQSFEENNILKINYQIIEVLLFLNKHNLPIISLNPIDIFLEKSLIKTEFHSIKIYYPYQNINNESSIRDRKEVPDLKSDVFKLGTLLLYIAETPTINKSLKTPMKMRELTGLEGEIIQDKVDLLRCFYSKSTIMIISSMLEFDLNKRPDLYQLLQTKNETNISKTQETTAKSILSRKLSYRVSTTSLSTSIASNKRIATTKLQKNSLLYIKKSIELTPQNKLKKHSSFINKSIKEKKLERNNSMNTKSQDNSFFRAKDMKFVINSTRNLTLFNEEKTPLNITPHKEVKSLSRTSSLVKKRNSSLSLNNKSFINKNAYKELFTYKESPDINEKSGINEPNILKNLAVSLLASFEKELESSSAKGSIVKKTYPDGSIYFGQLSHEKRDGKGVYYYPHGEVYAGTWTHDSFQGNGLYIYDNYEIYEGELKDGMKEGSGIYHYLQGDIYDGYWKRNKKHGLGVLTYKSSKEKYEGYWEEGEKHGSGVYYFRNGNKFEGQWIKGQKYGKGIVRFADGGFFEGEWKRNCPNGVGRLVYGNGDIYEGNYLCGIKEGSGIYVHKLGGKYEGKITEDGVCQDGIYSYSNNDKYIGKIKDSKREDYGEYIYSSGDHYKGQWKNNLKHGVGTLHLGDKSYYNGDWVEGRREGFGVMVYRNGEKYEGIWKKDQKEDKGKYSWPNEAFYEGEWKEDKMNGKGIYTNEQGEKFVGLWMDNLLVK